LGRFLGLIPPSSVASPPKLTGQGRGLPVTANSIDKVIIARTEPMDNRERQNLLQAISRVLKPGGDFIIINPVQPAGKEDTTWRSPDKIQKALERMSGFEVAATGNIGNAYTFIKARNL